MKNILIIGASSGIGKETAELLAKEGHQVFGTYNSTESSHSEINFHALNVLDEDHDLSFLPEKLDGLVYCPGSINLKPFGRISPKEFNEDFNLQVTGAIKIIQKVLPFLKRSEFPSVVLFSTVAVQLGFPFHAQVAASKGAIEGLTRSLAAELAPAIRINCIAPSLTNTPLAYRLLNSDEKKEANAQHHPLKRIGSVKDMAEMVKFLLEEKSGWITGQILHVDGGKSSINS
jgi:NAD(P)-dependent dehydrogenase (short-subunit alcohol dehydrogenase family)